MHEEEKTDQDIEIDLSEEDIENEDVFEISTEDSLRSLLDEESEKSKDLFDKFQRLQAEFDNYRKRMDARFTEAAKFASEDILLKVLEVYDNILRALEIDFTDDPKAAKKGVQAIQLQINKLLSMEGVRPIESVGQEFDPYYQHAVQKTHDPEKPDGVILEEFQKGYMLKEKVLRPAVVSVNRHEPPTADSSNDDNDDSNNNGE